MSRNLRLACDRLPFHFEIFLDTPRGDGSYYFFPAVLFYIFWVRGDTGVCGHGLKEWGADLARAGFTHWGWHLERLRDSQGLLSVSA